MYCSLSGEGLSTLHRSRSRGESINAVGTRTASRNKWIPAKGFPHTFRTPHNDIIMSHHLSRCWPNLTLNIHYCSLQNTFWHQLFCVNGKYNSISPNRLGCCLLGVECVFDFCQRRLHHLICIAFWFITMHF